MSQPLHESPHITPVETASAHDAAASCISEIVGDVECAKVGRGVVYRALRDIVCTGCGAHVRQGELFTRWQLRRATNLFDDPNTAAPRLAARCRACVSFANEAVESRLSESSIGSAVESKAAPEPQPPARRSPLIAHLLDGAVAAPSSTTSGSAKIKNERASHDDTMSPLEVAHGESYRRLAPALHTNRRTDLRSGAFRKTVPVKRNF